MATLKINDEANASTSIIIPFDAKWEDELRHKSITAIFRKRAPTSFLPDYIYVYVTSPASRLIGRLKVLSLASLPLAEAVKQGPKGGLTAEELTKYAGNYQALAVYSVDAFEKAQPAMSLSELQNAYSFFPPQSILRLSLTGKEALDAALGFNGTKPKTVRNRAR